MMFVDIQIDKTIQKLPLSIQTKPIKIDYTEIHLMLKTKGKMQDTR